MSKRPSAETQLREVRRSLRVERNAIQVLRDERICTTRDLIITRGKLTQAQQEAAEWRKRFDDLLARVPLKPIADGAA